MRRTISPSTPASSCSSLSAASRTYCEALARAGVRVFEYGPPMLHAKTMVIDDTVAVVGTANMDNRSFRLNFEVTAIVADPRFAGEVAAMFERDFARSRPVTREEVAARPLRQRAFSRAALLFAPIL